MPQQTKGNKQQPQQPQQPQQKDKKKTKEEEKVDKMTTTTTKTTGAGKKETTKAQQPQQPQPQKKKATATTTTTKTTAAEVVEDKKSAQQKANKRKHPATESKNDDQSADQQQKKSQVTNNNNNKKQKKSDDITPAVADQQQQKKKKNTPNNKQKKKSNFEEDITPKEEDVEKNASADVNEENGDDEGEEKQEASTTTTKALATTTKSSKSSKAPAVFRNKQRVLVFSSRGIIARHRHLMDDLRKLLPHSKKDAKMDSKDNLGTVNEICEIKSCNNCIFLESRKHSDLYMWVSKTPNGPSAKFLVQNIATMDELRMTGNCLLGSRPFLSFDAHFDEHPHLRLLKELFTQVFGTPKGHPKSKPFYDHILSFSYADKRIFFRNYQIIDPENPQAEMSLAEIGPRFVLNPIRIFSGSFGGETLYQNGTYVSPTAVRSLINKQKAAKRTARVVAKKVSIERHKALPMQAPTDFGEVFDGDE